ncbi:hypothetical protein LI82_10355 [Methanococcoides methylutens]|uniref:PKD domain-containing protein n=1 Tax=Methanococcoides methylutens TaxID=2226 RepID=A0A099T1P6_METMT|nr:PKD domain-containing protein [Methanococcoides methylutens]KGK98121.1 hypothetical protein LI82_10355 [Methanococcoides methylutens]
MNKNIFKSGILALLLLISVALIASPAAADPVMTRTLSDTTVVPGDTVHVTLELTGYVNEEGLNALMEDYSATEMAGWTLSNVECPPELDAYINTSGVHYFSRDLMSGAMPVGDYTVEYDLTVDADTETGTYDLIGTYKDSGNSAGYGPAVGDTQLTVNIPLPVADFESDVISGSIPLTVQFTDNSINAEAWEWDFDNDGLVDSTEQSPEHIFSTQGIYTVSLNISNDFGEDSVTKTDLITVTNVPIVLYDGEVSLYYADMNDGAALNATGLDYIVSGSQLTSVDGHLYENFAGPGTGSNWYTFINGVQVNDLFGFGSQALADGDTVEFILIGMDDMMGPNMIDQQYVVTINVNIIPAVELFNDSVYLSYSDMNDMNALNATGLDYNAPGGFIDTIDGIVASYGTTPEESVGWSIWLNGELAGSFGSNSLNESDVVEFVYSSYTGDLWEPNMLDQRYVVTITANVAPPVELFNDQIYLISDMNDMDALNATGLDYNATGNFLNSIDDIANDFSNEPETSSGWSIWLNGELAGSFGSNSLNESDVLEYVYSSYTGEMWEPNMLDQRYVVTIEVVEKTSTRGGGGSGTGSARIISSTETPLPPVEEQDPDVIVEDNGNDGDSSEPDADDSDSQGDGEYQEPAQQESDPNTPGFEMIFAVIGLLMSVYLAKRH